MIRDKIRASQLVNRLQDEALGKVSLTNGQRDSAKYLITQAIGNPSQSVDHEHDGKIVVEIKPFGGGDAE